MANTNGPDFEALTTLPGLMLLEESQVRDLMGHVKDGIVNGTKKVVMDLAMEEKYQYAAMNALRDGMRMVEMAFNMFMDTGPEEGPKGFNDQGFWEPSRWETAVCCMQGMDCWSGAFANAAGRAQLEADLANFQAELVGVQARYEELNVENERKLSE
jgi:hypothetical protein